MKTTINGKPDIWSPRIRALWDNNVAPKFLPHTTCESANYFTPRPAVDEWNKASNVEGFTYIVSPGRRVATWERYMGWDA